MKQIEKINDLTNRMKMCLDDDFKDFYENDIKSWIDELLDILIELKFEMQKNLKDN